MSLLKAAAALALVASLAACTPAEFFAAVLHLPATVQTDVSAVKTTVQTLADAQIPPHIAAASAAAFDAAETAGTDILTDCTPGAAVQFPAALCSSQHSNITNMAAVIKAGRVIRNAIEPAANQTLPLSESAYDKLQQDITTITNAVAAFNAAKAGN